ncbi:hypothetical protein BJ508DRAFT_330553 [Ascobolus immersus RN42]|uniref:Uncharacterized protein n=1 Tax=Ascobolus immersus RN42 TaxID=1160509 RepID=A0A3N4HYQ4_ASCIM|nr:hypothetical protein BJ508DRAFT_330553 [Ascobolus immersus RN42]
MDLAVWALNTADFCQYSSHQRRRFSASIHLSLGPQNRRFPPAFKPSRTNVCALKTVDFPPAFKPSKPLKAAGFPQAFKTPRTPIAPVFGLSKPTILAALSALNPAPKMGDFSRHSCFQSRAFLLVFSRSRTGTFRCLGKDLDEDSGLQRQQV